MLLLSVYCCFFRYRLSSETFGYTLVSPNCALTTSKECIKGAAGGTLYASHLVHYSVSEV